jgi:hypothetical protein
MEGSEAGRGEGKGVVNRNLAFVCESEGQAKLRDRVEGLVVKGLRCNYVGADELRLLVQSDDAEFRPYSNKFLSSTFI